MRRVPFIILAWASGCGDRPASPVEADVAAVDIVAATAIPVPPAPPAPVPTPAPSAAPPARIVLPTTPRDEMVSVPAGPFTMGCVPNGPVTCKADAQPRHQVTLSAYAIDKYEVTVGDYALCLASGKCWPPKCPLDLGAPNKPVTCLNRDGAAAYCQWVEKRLPTEAEWERAARGSGDAPFPWGTERPEGRACWKVEGPCDTGSFPEGASAVGALDMAGSVAEWVSDNYHPDVYMRSPRRDPKGYMGPSLTLVVCGSQSCAVARGGHWDSPIEHLATTTRVSHSRSGPDRFPRTGFRCARSSPAKP